MVNTKNNFLSCDWGTSAFRLRLIDINNLTTIVETNNNDGTAGTFELWKQNGKHENERLSFYCSVIQKSIDILEERLKQSLSGIPLIISGMASSTIGMLELPYKELPFHIDASDLKVQIIKATHHFNHDIMLVSGIKSENDVMRGEETQLVGCINEINHDERVFILPGTHSKHITVNNGKAIAFKTYMTGEFFNLLSSKSILSVTVEEAGHVMDVRNRQSFEQGVVDSMSLNILHACFLVRTNQLFNKLSKEENYYYLSGLLIGTELGELVHQHKTPITLVTNDVLAPYYQQALRIVKIDENVHTESADKAIVRGQVKIYQLNK
jgi:2-dehydro-3-deoxygalactonokinase